MQRNTTLLITWIRHTCETNDLRKIPTILELARGHTPWVKFMVTLALTSQIQLNTWLLPTESKYREKLTIRWYHCFTWYPLLRVLFSVKWFLVETERLLWKFLTLCTTRGLTRHTRERFVSSCDLNPRWSGYGKFLDKTAYFCSNVRFYFSQTLQLGINISCPKVDI